MCIVCNRQRTPAPNFERGLLFRSLQLTAAAKKVGLLVTEIMLITRAEQIGQGKPLLRRQCLQAKPSWLVLVLLTLCGVANAQSGRVHRCIGENGEPTFSDQKCGALKAAPAPENPTVFPAQAGIGKPTEANSALPVITQTCAISPTDLRERVVSAFASANAVGFSGLFLWDGFGEGSAIAPLRDLAALIREPLLSINLEPSSQFRDGDQSGPGNIRRDDDKLFELVIRTVGQQERNVPFESVRQYELSEQRGCWWLRMPW